MPILSSTTVEPKTASLVMRRISPYKLPILIQTFNSVQSAQVVLVHPHYSSRMSTELLCLFLQTLGSIDVGVEAPA